MEKRHNYVWQKLWYKNAELATKEISHIQTTARNMACKITLLYLTFFLVVSTIANPIQLDANEIEDDDDFIDLSQLDGRAFGDPDEEVGKVLQEALNDTAETGFNPEELGSYFEGDILMPKIEGRSALADKSKRWPGGVVPYKFEGHFRKFKNNA